MGGRANTLKSRSIKKLNMLLEGRLYRQMGDVYIIADEEGHWSISYRYELSNIQIGIWDEEFATSPAWKIVWDILKLAREGENG